MTSPTDSLTQAWHAEKQEADHLALLDFAADIGLAGNLRLAQFLMELEGRLDSVERNDGLL